MHVTGDADSARAGAFLGAPGVVVIAGTGSMASGWNGESSARAGGHGFLLGDEGGAYWIGRAAVRAALRWEDGMGGGSERIHRAVIQATGQGLDALICEVCTHPAERDRLTALAPAITALAAEDPEARKIALRAAEHLADLAEAIRRRLGPLPVAGAGRVFSAPVIWDRFAELTGAVRPLAAATVGAALLAGQNACQNAADAGRARRLARQRCLTVWTESARCSTRRSARAASPALSSRSAGDRSRSAAGPPARPTRSAGRPMQGGHRLRPRLADQGGGDHHGHARAGRPR